MQFAKSALASIAACGLLLSQSAAAAPASRVGVPVGPGEDLAGIPEGSAPVLTLLALLALVAGIALIVGGDDDEAPTSP